MTLKQRLKKARAAYMARRSSTNLRRYLRLKATAGRFDSRMCSYYGVSPKVNPACRRAICRAYAAGLVPTSTTGGKHAPGSYHTQLNSRGEGRGIDLGLRRDEVGTQKGLKRMETFQRKELWRFRHGKLPQMAELIGPNNFRIVLRGVETNLVEGNALEQAHDNHVHEGYHG